MATLSNVQDAHYTVEVILTAGNSETIKMWNKVSSTMISIIPVGGDSVVQTTNDLMENVVNGSALWFDWDQGAVVAAAQDATFAPINAVKITCNAGTCRAIVTINEMAGE